MRMSSAPGLHRLGLVLTVITLIIACEQTPASPAPSLTQPVEAPSAITIQASPTLTGKPAFTPKSTPASVQTSMPTAIVLPTPVSSVELTATATTPATPSPESAPLPTVTPSPTATPTLSATAVTASGFTIYFIDVGQGDATLIVSSTGESLLVDGGRSRARIRERLQALDITDLDAIAMTHPDADHIAGLVEVLELYPIEHIYLNGGTSVVSLKFVTQFMRPYLGRAAVVSYTDGHLHPYLGVGITPNYSANLWVTTLAVQTHLPTSWLGSRQKGPR